MGIPGFPGWVANDLAFYSAWNEMHIKYLMGKICNLG